MIAFDHAGDKEELYLERGTDWEAIVEEAIADKIFVINKAKELAARLPGSVDWRELLSLPSPEI